MALAGASASPVADPALVYAGIPAVGGVVAPVVGTVDTGLKFHPSSGAVTPDFTAEQKEAAPELTANQKDIKHLAYTGAVVHRPTPFSTPPATTWLASVRPRLRLTLPSSTPVLPESTMLPLLWLPLLWLPLLSTPRTDLLLMPMVP